VPDHAAFLRAINVSGRRATRDDLRACFEAIGLREVDVFRASGNVVFSADTIGPRELKGRIEDALAAALGYEVATFLRTADEVRAIARERPFAATEGRGKLQVAFLVGPPQGGVRERVLELATEADRLAFGERELYWLPSGGTMESDLDRNALVRMLGPMTFRTKNTVDQIARKFFGV
jgi:uncharacterized protein (DUF1697 family)